MSLVWSLLRSCVGSHADETLWAYLLTSLGASLMANSPVLWLFTLIIQWACAVSHSFFTGSSFTMERSGLGPECLLYLQGERWPGWKLGDMQMSDLLKPFSKYRHTQIRNLCLKLQHPWRCHRSFAYTPHRDENYTKKSVNSGKMREVT